MKKIEISKSEMLILMGILLLDLSSKLMIEQTMDLYQSIPIIRGFFHITYLHNNGAAWGIFSGAMSFFYLATMIGISLLVYWFYCSSSEEKLYRVSLVMMIAGTLGNFYDRISFQYVRDFLDFYIFGYDFPAFNVADMALCIGVFLMAVSIFLEEKKKKHE